MKEEGEPQARVKGRAVKFPQRTNKEGVQEEAVRGKEHAFGANRDAKRSRQLRMLSASAAPTSCAYSTYAARCSGQRSCGYLLGKTQLQLLMLPSLSGDDQVFPRRTWGLHCLWTFYW